MGLFSKKDVDGFPKKYIDMWASCCDTPSLKYIKEEDIFPCLQKMFEVGVDAIEKNKMGDVYSDISIGRFVSCAIRLADAYERGEISYTLKARGGWLPTTTVKVCEPNDPRMYQVYAALDHAATVFCKKQWWNTQNVDAKYGDLSNGNIIWWTRQAAHGYAAGFVDGAKDQKKAQALMYRAFEMYDAINRTREKQGVIEQTMSYPFEVDLGIPEMLEGRFSTPGIRQQMEWRGKLKGYDDLGMSAEGDVKIFMNEASTNLYALYMLGECYYRGRGIEKDKDKGVELWKLASSQGFMKASEMVQNSCSYSEKEEIEKYKQEMEANERKYVTGEGPSEVNITL